MKSCGTEPILDANEIAKVVIRSEEKAEREVSAYYEADEMTREAMLADNPLLLSEIDYIRAKRSVIETRRHAEINIGRLTIVW